MVINKSRKVKGWRAYIGLTLFGGLVVALPIAIFLFLLQWLFGLVTGFTAPFSRWLFSWTTLPGVVTDLIGLLLLLGIFFLIGLLVKTSMGSWLHGRIDQWLVRFAPGYGTIREVVKQLVGGDGESPILRGQVCRAYILGPDSPVSVTAIVTAYHSNGDLTVYVPTAPIPSSGFVYHLHESCVELLPHISVETAMRTVISCGIGSQVIGDPPPDEDKAADAQTAVTGPSHRSGAEQSEPEQTRAEQAEAESLKPEAKESDPRA